MNQRILWDSLVDIRINFQNLLDMANCMPHPPEHALFVKAVEQDHMGVFDDANAALQGLLEDMCHLQEKLLATDSVVEVEVPTKSEHHIEWDYITQTQNKIEQVCGPILDKWQTKALLPSASNRNKTLKLKTINQSIMNQVESSLSGHNLDNLVKRTQMVPEDAKKIFGVVDWPVDKEGGNAEEKPKRQYDDQIYNDEDFYSVLLRDRIQSGVQGLGDTSDPITMSQQYLRLHQLRKRKRKKANVDRRASKGRKIRYHVHEKLTTFMAPLVQKYPQQDSLLTQRLFRSMFGATHAPVQK